MMYIHDYNLVIYLQDYYILFMFSLLWFIYLLINLIKTEIPMLKNENERF